MDSVQQPQALHLLPQRVAQQQAEQHALAIDALVAELELNTDAVGVFLNE